MSTEIRPNPEAVEDYPMSTPLVLAQLVVPGLTLLASFFFLTS